MKCAWNELLSILPQEMKPQVDRLGRQDLQELRLRCGAPPELVVGGKSLWLTDAVTSQQLEHVVNLASRYSPWASNTTSFGYLTAPGGHRIGLCGMATEKGFRQLTSLNIRVARDFPGIAMGLPKEGNLLIIGPPGCGKTTLLRDFARFLAENLTVSVVDERGELFPQGFSRGKRMDVLTGRKKPDGIEMVLRTMAPQVIVADEITSTFDCDALLSTAWCGVQVVATAHASSRQDLMGRGLYRPILQLGIFDHLVIMQRDKSWRLERMVL